MPTVRKIAPIAVEPKPLLISKRAQIAREYDAYLASFVVGDYGRAELIDGERRAVVRQRLQAATRRRGLVLRFRSGPGPLTFQVRVAPAIGPTPPQEPIAATPVAAPYQRPLRPPRPPRQRQSAAERYHDLLPRWMRTGQQEGRPKRRPR
jgi:hypothetical protein